FAIFRSPTLMVTTRFAVREVNLGERAEVAAAVGAGEVVFMPGGERECAPGWRRRPPRTCRCRSSSPARGAGDALRPWRDRRSCHDRINEGPLRLAGASERAGVEDH